MVTKYHVCTMRMLPCPHCGGSDLQIDVSEFRYPDRVVLECVPLCKTCDYEGDDYPSITDAVNAWNENRECPEYME